MPRPDTTGKTFGDVVALLNAAHDEITTLRADLEEASLTIIALEGVEVQRTQERDAHKARADKLTAEDTARAEAARRARIDGLKRFAVHALDCVPASRQVGNMLECSCGLTEYARRNGVPESELEAVPRHRAEIDRLRAPRRVETYTGSVMQIGTASELIAPGDAVTMDPATGQIRRAST